MELLDEKIVRLSIREGAVIDLQAVKLQEETLSRIVAGKGKFAVLVDSKANYTVTAEAKAYAAVNAVKRVATAVVSGNPVSVFILNSYLSVFKPASPYRHFMSEEKALEWLKEKIKDQNPICMSSPDGC
ncbi:MAG: hypothetical protein Fur0041_19030 [Bacteroidia bacterium]